MKFGITSKLFLALLATSVVVAVAMGAAMHVSFTRGFLGYLNGQELARVERLAPAFVTAYQDRGGWEFLREERREWFQLLRSADPMSAEEGPPEGALTGFYRRLGLLDGQGEPVAGSPPPVLAEATLRPLSVNGETVGYLALLPFQRASSAAALAFEQRQLRALWIIGLLSLALAAVVALALARWLLSPVRRIAAATRRLAAGEYEQRIEVDARDELGALAEDFNRLALSLARNERLRRAFMADVSHELRTPLAVLRGEIEAMEDGVRPLSPASLGSLKGEVATLGKLVEDLYELSLADVGALSYRMAPLDLRESLEAALAAHGERLAARGLTVERALEGPLPVRGDVQRLRQLFGNLLENSVRYTDPGGRLRVSARREGEGVAVDLQDSAPGVAEDQLPRLFDRLYRVEGSRSRESGGAGLGLAICESIVEAHGGRIEARPSPLGGLWVSLWLPS